MLFSIHLTVKLPYLLYMELSKTRIGDMSYDAVRDIEKFSTGTGHEGEPVL